MNLQVQDGELRVVESPDHASTRRLLSSLGLVEAPRGCGCGRTRPATCGALVVVAEDPDRLEAAGPRAPVPVVEQVADAPVELLVPWPLRAARAGSRGVPRRSRGRRGRALEVPPLTTTTRLADGWIERARRRYAVLPCPGGRRRQDQGDVTLPAPQPVEDGLGMGIAVAGDDLVVGGIATTHLGVEDGQRVVVRRRQHDHRHRPVLRPTRRGRPSPARRRIVAARIGWGPDMRPTIAEVTRRLSPPFHPDQVVAVPIPWSRPPLVHAGPTAGPGWRRRRITLTPMEEPYAGDVSGPPPTIRSHGRGTSP